MSCLHHDIIEYNDSKSLIQLQCPCIFISIPIASPPSLKMPCAIHVGGNIQEEDKKEEEEMVRTSPMTSCSLRLKFLQNSYDSC
mmetsp:Transcript_24719/g.31643  ORF Transcript_24719/g.31643 Transcript_24719/m.31643 type:complete len:84 (+) Transcript_24719:879-1130(+)